MVTLKANVSAKVFGNTDEVYWGAGKCGVTTTQVDAMCPFLSGK